VMAKAYVNDRRNMSGRMICNSPRRTFSESETDKYRICHALDMSIIDTADTVRKNSVT